jgi:hypothetical protein
MPHGAAVHDAVLDEARAAGEGINPPGIDRVGAGDVVIDIVDDVDPSMDTGGRRQRQGEGGGVQSAGLAGTPAGAEKHGKDRSRKEQRARRQQQPLRAEARRPAVAQVQPRFFTDSEGHGLPLQ